MVEKIYYIENSNALELAIDSIAGLFPCWIEKEFIEMNYVKITLHIRTEDLASAEDILAPLV